MRVGVVLQNAAVMTLVSEEEMVAGREPDEDNMLTKVARTVGSALGTVASKAANLVGSNSDEASSKPKRKGKKAKTTTGLRKQAQPRKQSKRTKNLRKPSTKNARVTRATTAR